jgi:hypothetical protein
MFFFPKLFEGGTCEKGNTCNLMGDMFHPTHIQFNRRIETRWALFLHSVVRCLNRGIFVSEFSKPHASLKLESYDVLLRRRYIFYLKCWVYVRPLCELLVMHPETSVTWTLLCLSNLFLFLVSTPHFPIVVVTYDLNQVIFIVVILNLYGFIWKLVEDSGCQSHGRRSRSSDLWETFSRWGSLLEKWFSSREIPTPAIELWEFLIWHVVEAQRGGEALMDDAC